jgi:hypothetical protein
MKALFVQNSVFESVRAHFRHFSSGQKPRSRSHDFPQMGVLTMRFRRAFAVAALAAFAFISGPQGDGWSPVGEALAKQSNGNAGGNGNNGNGAGNGNGQATPKANLAPLADAGLDRAVLAGQTVVLDGSGSVDPDGDPVVFSWEIVTRPIDSNAQLSDPKAVRPNFTADMPGAYEFSLTLDDGYVLGAPDHVTVSTANVAPAADAGSDDAVPQGAAAMLDGTGSSDGNGDRITYSWLLVGKPSGSVAEFSDPANPQSSFLTDLPGDYVAELTVNDGWATSAAGRVTLSTGNVAPAAHAGWDLATAATGQIALEAEESFDANGDPLSFRWTVLSAPENARYQIRNSTERRAFLLFEDAGTYVVQLTATDDSGAAGFDTAIVSDGNVAPIANAGADQVVREAMPWCWTPAAHPTRTAMC